MATQKPLVIDNGTTQQIANADTLLVGVAVEPSTGTALRVGAAAGTTTTTFPGPVRLDGDVTTVGGTTFTTDATFEGNVTFGNGPADTVTFAATTTVVSDINFATPVAYKITNLANGTNPNDAVNVSQLSALVTGVSAVTASSPLSSSGGATPDISFPTWPANASGVLTNNGSGTLSWAAAPSGSLTVGTTAIVSGAVNRVLFEGAGNVLQESANLTWDGSAFTVNGVVAVGEGSAPAGTAAFGKLWANSAADARPYWIDDTGQSFNLTLDRFNTLTPAASVAIDTSPALPVFNSLALNQNTTFTTSNLGNGRSASGRVVCDGTTRTLTFPGTWTWLGSGPPADLAANDVGYLSITAYGATDADVVAAWSYENMPAVVTGSGVSNRVAFWSSTTDLTSDADLTYDSTTNALTVGTVLGVRRTASGDTGFALAGAGDSDTGIVFNQWGVGANTLSIYANGSQSAYFTQTRLVSGALGGANLFMGTGTAALPQYSGTGDTATGFFIQTVAGVSASGVARQTWSTTGSVVNDDGNNFDFRVESQGNANMLFVDASANAVGIGTATPASALSVGSSSQFQVSSTGDIVAIRGQTTTFPATNASGVLTNNGSGTLSWAAAPAASLTVGSTAIASGAANRILFEGAGNVLQESANLTWDGTTFGVTGGITQTTGAVSLTANAASSLTTSAGALTLTSAAAATWSSTAGNLAISGGAALQLTAAAGNEVVVNDGSANVDFRVESDNNANMLLVDASQDSVSIGTTGNTHTFNIGTGASANFCVASGGRIHTYDGTAPTNGQVLIGDTALGNFAKATLTAGTGIAITNGAGTISIAASNAAGVQPITTIGVTTTLDGTNYTVLCSATLTVNLPAAASNTGRVYNIKNIGAAATITIDPNAAETIDGATTYTLTTQYESVTLQCDGSAWFIL